MDNQVIQVSQPGKVVGNKKLESEGEIDKATGKARADYGDLKEDVKDVLKKP